MCYWDQTWRLLATEGRCSFPNAWHLRVTGKWGMSAFPWCKWKGIPATASVFYVSFILCGFCLYISNACWLSDVPMVIHHPWSRSVIPAEEWGVSLAQCVSDFSTCYDSIQGRNDGKRMFIFVCRLENVRLGFMVLQATPSCIKTVFAQVIDFLGGLHFTVD